MRIVNVTPGILPVPPNGWGAVEKIIWEYHNNFIKKGHESEILYLNSVDKIKYDIIHIHVANLANMAYDKNMPYYFTLHDHHAYLYGKDSYVFKENYKAMKNAIKAFVPAKYLVEYFDLPNVEYIPHGVNTDTFINKDKPKEHKLLCLAKNGYHDRPMIDRKGFLLAIEAAKKLNLPITIAGPESNRVFLEHHKVEYNKLNIITDLSEEELIDCYNNHTIFLHPSELEAGHPNLTLLEAISCGLPIVGTLEDNNELNGLIKCKRDVNDIYDKLKYVIDNYDKISDAAYNESKKRSWDKMTDKLIEKYNDNFYTSSDMRKDLIDVYENTTINPEPINNTLKVHLSFKNGAFLKIINGAINTEYKAEFIDLDSNIKVYETSMMEGYWAKPNTESYIKWQINIYNNNDLEYTHTLDLENKNVHIKFESSSIGDTIAWFPYVEEFRKKHNCNVYVTTYHNNLFKLNYPNIKFIEPGVEPNDIYAAYRLGIYYTHEEGINRSLNKNDYRNIPLQQVGSDALGLEYREIKPDISIKNTENPFPNQKVVSIAINSTAQAKYWNHSNGWQTVTDYLIKNGYKVILLGKEGNPYMGNYYPDNVTKVDTNDIKDVLKYLKYSEFFIGIGSGISWLSWAINCPTILISGFSKPYTEFNGDNVYRVHNNSVCNGCFNRHLFDKSDWNWCPDKKGTNEQFICSVSITPDMVIGKIDLLINRRVDDGKKTHIEKTDISLTYDNTCNKLNFISNIATDIKISVKDIDSKMPIYFFQNFGEFWAIPVPKNVYDFEDQNFGGFQIDIFDLDMKPLRTVYKRLRYPKIYKPVFDVGDVELSFINYNEFFVDKICDNLDLENLEVILDIGANVGIWTKWMMMKNNPKKIYSFEPNKNSIKVFNKIHKSDRITLINKAFHYENNLDIDLYSDPSNSTISSLTKGNLNHKYKVKTINLENFMVTYNVTKIDLLKIDIEGFEFDIFDNYNEKEFNVIDRLLIETHAFNYENGVEKKINLINKLKSYGYKHMNINTNLEYFKK